MDDLTLLREYATRHSEEAFEELVSRYIHLVYSAALRQTGDSHLAEEVTQAVFIVLAEKAGRISHDTILSGWFFKTTRFVAFTQTRTAARRRRYEQEACMHAEDQRNPPNPLWEKIAPLLDKALAQLGEKDRQAVLLRFFEDKNLAEVGSSLGTTEDAARMRINRALEKLHRYFTKQGVVSTSACIAAAISANSVQAAPIITAKTITAVAVAKGAAAGSSSLTLAHGAIKLMAWAKAKTAILCAACVLLVSGTSLFALYAVRQPAQGLPEGWTVLDGTAEQWNWADGKIQAHSLSNQTILASPDAYRDFSMSAMVNTTNREASFAVRMQDAANGYLVIFSPGNTPHPYGRFVAISKEVEGREYRLGTYSGRLIPAAGEPTKLGITANKAWLQVTLNETIVLRLKDPTYESGRIGLRIFGDGAYPCDATFSKLTFSGTPMAIGAAPLTIKPGLGVGKVHPHMRATRYAR